jgi:PAS domain S-box-containing protein
MSQTGEPVVDHAESLFTLMLDAFVVAGFDGYMKVVNPALAKMLGYGEQELLATPYLELVHPDDVESVEAAFVDLAAGADLVGFVCRLVCADRTVRWVEWHTKARPEEGLVYGVGRDVTERKMANDELSALRRVATLVAEGKEPRELFAVVAKEVAGLIDVPVVGIARYEPDDVATTCASFSAEGPLFPIGRRWSLEGTSTLRLVRDTSAPARIDDYSGLEGEVAELVRGVGLRSSVAIPIAVAGRLWGAIVVTSPLRLPEGTEERLADFSELIATAIANAESREALELLADEQAALHGVASLVAQGAASSVVLDAVAAEMQTLLGADQVALNRYETSDEIVLLAHRGIDLAVRAIGSRVSHEGENVTSIVRRTGRPGRIESYEGAAGPLGEHARATGLRSSVSAPIVIDGNAWGLITASWKGEEAPPGDTEERMAKFAQLLATAIANTEARDEVARLAEEQAALRRVATLVARGEAPSAIFAAVSQEVENVFTLDETSDLATVVRFDPGPEFVLVGAAKTFEGLEIGSRWAPKELYVSTKVFRTGRSARVEESDLVSLGGADGETLLQQGLLSQVGSPIIVEGRVWGAITMNAKETLPPDTEPRLASFTELVATAIANTEARAEVERLAEEQAALRRVATLVADQAAPSLIFASVAEELAHTVAADRCAIGRYEEGDALTIVAYWSGEEQKVPAGTRIDVGNDEVVAAVRKSGQLLRIDDHEAFSGPLMDYARSLGSLPSSTIAAPVLVGGHMWGTIFTSTMAAVPFPEGTESRITDFADLMATAIANADSREALASLVHEQAALRRVATLVAQGVQPSDIFDAVSKEVQGVLHLDAAPSDVATVVRFDSGPECVLVGTSKPIEESPLGSRWEPDDLYASTRVLRTGKSARVDEDDLSIGGPEAEKMRRQGCLSQVASPIVVEGRLWGSMTASATEPLPSDTETRLEKFTELVATAVANAEGKSALAASRRRIVTASDETRRRIERDLHDGTQQRLVSLGLAVRAAEANIPPDRPDLQGDLSQIAAGLAGAVEDVQELSRGIHPAILSRGGLVPALRTLARRSALPVKLDVSTDVPVPEPIEVAAYFVASEALANAIKHADATCVEISLDRAEECLLLAIRDDGVGGADSARGSGLVGLTDRVDALGGSLEIESRPGDGTEITVRLPIELGPDSSEEPA